MRPDWRAEAACTDHLPLFYASITRDRVDRGIGPRDTPIEAAAKVVCSDCPSRRPCLTFALDGEERYGVWGGTNSRDRLTMQPRRQQ